jgi:hypothetical protein
VLREELPAQLAGYQQELAAGQADKTRREWLEWHIRRVQKRMPTLRLGWRRIFSRRERREAGELRDVPTQLRGPRRAPGR